MDYYEGECWSGCRCPANAHPPEHPLVGVYLKLIGFLIIRITQGARQTAFSQGSRSVAEYAVEFGTLVAELGWNEAALQGAFRCLVNPSYSSRNPTKPHCACVQYITSFIEALSGFVLPEQKRECLMFST